mmetsp:Transcript_6277/g.8875  ORF Transcript_6277/g.8875 Transcript_6277/m.8875 type:complete len:130 (-) Transcript_6277:1281-1670(-)
MKRKQPDQSHEGSESIQQFLGQNLKSGDASNKNRVVPNQFANAATEGVLGAATLGLPATLPFDAASLVQLQAQQQLAQFQSPATLVNGANLVNGTSPIIAFHIYRHKEVYPQTHILPLEPYYRIPLLCT